MKGKLFFGPKEIFCFPRPVLFLNLFVGKFAEDVMGRILMSDVGWLSEMTSAGSFPTLRRSNLLKLCESVKLEFS